MSDIKRVKAELIDTDYPIFEDQFQDLDPIPCTLVYSERSTRAELKTVDDFFFAIQDITELHDDEENIYIANDGYYWSFRIIG